MKGESVYEGTLVESLDSVDETDWDKLAGSNPFMTHRFLRLMQESSCVSEKKGWVPRYAVLRLDGVLVAASTCYLKLHSRGEFVFDQGWAEAFERHGLNYYPKLLVAAPFTPVQGPRLLARDDDAR